MKLNIPAQNAPTATSSPSDPGELKQLLSDLPNSNMGELTKQTFQILRDQNRQVMPSQARLDNLEMLRLLSRKIFDSLKKYFINRTLPLPEKSKKIVNLNQSILQELIFGYEIIIQNAANNTDTTIDDKTLSTAICRALMYLSEMLLRASEVYQPYPKNLWYDAHQLYLFSESKNLLDITIFDDEIEAETTITNSYKHILLFALARPITLRQSDCDRVFKELFEWSKYTHIQQQASNDLIDHVFSMRVFEDAPPDHLKESDLAEDIIIRTLDTRELVAHVKNQVVEKNKQKQKQKFEVGNAIPLETLMTLVTSWSKNVERRFTRAERNAPINVSIGLSKICKAMHESKITSSPVKPDNHFVQTSSKLENSSGNPNNNVLKTTIASNNEQSFTLKSIDNDERRQRDISIGNDDENEWEMVAKGRVLTQTYEREKQLIDESELEKRRQDSDLHWEIVNISAGGYCLHWTSDKASTAQVGELIALQEFDLKKNFIWHVGAIRWMQHTLKNGLEIGVQTLSPKAEATTSQRANRLDETPFDCILLPEIKALKQSATAILPAHAFTMNNKLVVKILDSIISVTLGDVKEHTGSFTQFTYNSTELDRRIKKQMRKEDALENKDDFDELCSSL